MFKNDGYWLCAGGHPAHVDSRESWGLLVDGDNPWVQYHRRQLTSRRLRVTAPAQALC